MNESKVYVGNLSYNTTEDQLRDFFSQYGEIEDIKLISDFQTGRSKGFGFITYSSDEEAKNALAADGADLDNRKIRVNIAKDNNSRRGGGGGGGAGRGSRSGGGGGYRSRDSDGNR